MTVTAHAAAPPGVPIAAPAVATGVVTVSVPANVDASDIDGARTTLLVNGTPLGAPRPCGPSNGPGADCPNYFAWDTTELNGTFTLTARITVPSAPGVYTDGSITVTAANPLPQVAVTSPSPGSVVKGGTLTVHAQGTIDLSQVDHPAALQLWVDGARYGLPQACTEVDTTARTCDADFTVTQPGWSGSHDVQVTMTTTLTSANSAVAPYLFYTATRTSLQPLAAVRAGKRVGIRGSVVGLNAGAPVAGARVVVTIAPAIGNKKTVVLRTGSTGHFSLAATISANSTVTAAVTGAAAVGASHASTKVKALAPIVCKADLSVRHGRDGAGTCNVAHLPDGTTVSLQYQAKKKWHVLGSGTTSGTSIVISYKFGAAGKYPVRLVLGANKVYAATYGTPFVVKVS